MDSSLDYSAGHITTEESSKLIGAVNHAFGKKGEIEFYPGLDYRHFLILRNFQNPELIVCTPPHDATGISVSAVLPKAKSPEAEKTAQLLRNLINGSRDILKSHPSKHCTGKSRQKTRQLNLALGRRQKTIHANSERKVWIEICSYICG